MSKTMSVGIGPPSGPRPAVGQNVWAPFGAEVRHRQNVGTRPGPRHRGGQDPDQRHRKAQARPGRGAPTLAQPARAAGLVSLARPRAPSWPQPFRPVQPPGPDTPARHRPAVHGGEACRASPPGGAAGLAQGCTRPGGSPACPTQRRTPPGGPARLHPPSRTLLNPARPRPLPQPGQLCPCTSAHPTQPDRPGSPGSAFLPSSY